MVKTIKKSKSGNYTKRCYISSYIDSLWDRIGKKLSSKGITSADVRKAIKAMRREKLRAEAYSNFGKKML